MSVLPFKEDDDFRKHNQFTGEAAGEELRTFLGDFEAFDAQIADARSDQSDLITVMKSKGWNVKALRRLVAERKRDADDLREEQEVVAMYRDLLL